MMSCSALSLAEPSIGSFPKLRIRGLGGLRLAPIARRHPEFFNDLYAIST
jgi:hypothetical protein